MKKLLILGALAVLAFKGVSKVKTLVKLEFGTAGIKLDKTKTGLKNGLVLLYGLQVYNPTQVPLTYRGFAGNIYDSKNQRIGNIDSSTVQPNIKIAARANTILPLNVIIPPAAFAGQFSTIIKNLLSSSKVKLQGVYTIRGMLNITGLPPINVDESFDFSEYNL